ncbi:hypothetical protein JCM3775_004590 [Rhodotorula graminis]|uniref:PRELI/MSF1 domain-containing protein n=1 Tax=Rhodotorula graminis (strain WP1) TaxID=578459 RepID=A0A194S924_RHOGW|nr:uncharacterized protein RHOBADRAFT_51940 [Rhodotorula graminis WP1]KPV76965.1 hypothetical protein RHOBADRAFT_51940 [Rhodotorula graminis WP1]
MVQTLETSDTFPVPFPYIVLAHNQRYPSPYGKHILSSDVISRTFHPATNSLRTTRLILKRGKVPRWAPQVIQRIDTTWVLEETEVHVGLEGPDGQLEEGGSAGGPRRELRTRSRNIDRTEFMEVFEWQVFRQKPDDPLATDVKTFSRVTSEFGFWPLANRIESFGVSKLPRSIEGARLGLLLVAELLLRPSTAPTLLASGPLKPFAFDPVPSPLTLAVRQKLVEARSAWQVEQDARRDAAGAGEGGEGGEGGARKEPRGLRVWRERWRGAVQRGKRRFRHRVCAVTGLLCDEPEPAAAGVGVEGPGAGP